LIALAEALAAAGEWERAITTGIEAGGLTDGGDPEQSQKVALWVENLKERASQAQQGKRDSR
jgi:hypothetical protein